MRVSSIIMKLRQIGFDEFYQAGSRNRFHPLNIVAESRILNLQFWICAEGGYNVAETYHIASRSLDDVRSPTERTDFKTQTELIAGLEDIQRRIARAVQGSGESPVSQPQRKEVEKR